MRNLLLRAIKKYQTDGLLPLLKVTSRLCYRKLLLSYLQFSPPLPPLTVQLQVDDTTAKFTVTSPKELKRLGYGGSVDESPILRDFLTKIRGDDIVYDVGANIGTHTAFAASRLSSGRVVAFEPMPNNLRKLRANCTALNVPIDIHDVALADENTTRDLHIVGTKKAGEGRHRLGGSNGEQTVSVRTSQADDYVKENGLPHPTVVKIDVEGAEMAVLRGMQDLLADSSCRLVYCEVHHDSRPETGSPDIRDYGHEPSEVREYLVELGFEVKRIYEKNTPVPKGHVLRATRKSE
ncbi:FkbM family methyltransferase [Haloarcula montana]|uniref:FkbM family methyltransferase n=1 Tax=Haloarcula montana TaxID=3111776 RepID=UPI002D79C31C|nr:FkbM family methyltransferase [Haloarcula sp. GH36]